MHYRTGKTTLLKCAIHIWCVYGEFLPPQVKCTHVYVFMCKIVCEWFHLLSFTFERSTLGLFRNLVCSVSTHCAATSIRSYLYVRTLHSDERITDMCLTQYGNCSTSPECASSPWVRRQRTASRWWYWVFLCHTKRALEGVDKDEIKRNVVLSVCAS